MAISANNAFSKEPLCESFTGRVLSLQAGYGAKLNPGEEYVKAAAMLASEFDRLCESDKSAEDIMKAIFQKCSEAASSIKNKAQKELLREDCHNSYAMARSFQEGLKFNHNVSSTKAMEPVKREVASKKSDK